MKKTKLFSLLKTLNPKEWKSLSDFIRSPYFNKQEKMICLFDALMVYFSGTKTGQIPSKQDIYQTIFPNQPFDDKAWNHLSNQFLQLIYRFLALQEDEGNSFKMEYNIQKACLEKGAEKHFSFLFKKADRNLNKAPVKDASYYFNRFSLSELRNQHFLMQKVRKYDPQLQDLTDHLDQYYFLQKLKFSCEILDRRTFLSTEYSLHFIKEVSQYLDSKPSLYNDSIRIYHVLFKMLTHKASDQYFKEFQMCLKSADQLFSKEELKDLNTYAINYCLRKIRKGEDQYQENLLELYLQGINSQLLFENGFLSPWTFKNVVKLALRLKRFSWAESFIKDHVNDLRENFRDTAYYYNLADLNYYQQNHQKAAQLLLKTEFNDIYYYMDSRVMLAKIYFETDESEPLFYLINSFRVYLNRNQQISDNARKSYQNFINLLSTLSRGNLKEPEKLKSTIQQIPLLTERSWLLKMSSEKIT